MPDKTNLSRRGLFLNATAAGAAVATGTLAVPAATSAQAATPAAKWNSEADVVVIGAA